MYARLRYLFNEGFYLFALSYSQIEQKGWLEYAPIKTLSSKNTTEEEFEDITLREFKKCKSLYHKGIENEKNFKTFNV